jgi:hypothetical protein
MEANYKIKELFVKRFFFFFNTYDVGTAVIASWPASGISSELLKFNINFTEMPP